MKIKGKIMLLLVLPILLLVLSCRTEEMELIETPTEEALEINSAIANLMLRVVMNDGSGDNIIDQANCLEIQFPFTVIVNGIEVIVNSEDDFDTIEDIIDEFDNDTDTIIIVFPITVILSDFTEVVINNLDELNDYASQCSGENEIDDDIECIDFHYPITASIFNTNNELIETIVIENDEDLYDLIEMLDEGIIVTIDFPITVTLWDGTDVIINNMQELQTVILGAIDQCDEDDDYDNNDDDCDNCTSSDLDAILTDCENWIVDKLERNDEDLEDQYTGFLFNFFSDGTLTVDEGGNTHNGTWSSSGDGNNISVDINIPDYPDYNDVWTLHEIEQDPDETEVDLRIGDDRLRFESDCIEGGGGIDDTELVNALTTGEWYVTFYFDDEDETSNYNDFVFNFNSDGTATATDSGGPTNGTWSTSPGDETELGLNLNFGGIPPLDELADDWDVLEVTNDIIRLKDISGGDGSEDFLTFERDPVGGGGGGSDLDTILTDGTWYVATYLDDGDNETGDYNGYDLTFNSNGTVIADNGSPIYGTWAVLNGGNNLLLDFGSSFPFDEFNDDWDVLSVTQTQVDLQDVSGGGGGTDTLIFVKN
jgi:hypothetical protein